MTTTQDYAGDDRRKPANAPTRTAVDYASNLGAVIARAVDDLIATATYAGDDKRSQKQRLTILRHCATVVAADLHRALLDEHAERAAFLEHFPHLRRKESDATENPPA